MSCSLHEEKIKSIDPRYHILSPIKSRSYGWCVTYKDEFIGIFGSLEKAHEFIKSQMRPCK